MDRRFSFDLVMRRDVLAGDAGLPAPCSPDRLSRSLAKRAEHRPLARPGEHRQNPQDSAFPLMKDAKTAGIGLEGFAGQRRDRLDVPGKNPLSQPNEIVNHSGPFRRGDAVHIALRPTGKA